MKKTQGQIRIAASDLTDFLACPYLTYLRYTNIDSPLEESEPDEQAVLIRKKGEEHERTYLESLKRAGLNVVNCKIHEAEEDRRSAFTSEQLKAGVQIAYQGCLLDGAFFGYSDFLEKVELPSELGCFSYEIIDSKLSSTPKPSFIIQLCFYSELLSKVQGRLPRTIHLVLGDFKRRSYSLCHYYSYYLKLKDRFLSFLESSKNAPPPYPIPCSHCSLCDYQEHCSKKRLEDHHLSLVANIRNSQIKKLESSGIKTLEALALLDISNLRIPKFNKSTLKRLKHQAALQVSARQTGRPEYELLPQEKDNLGFFLLSDPNPGDLFYDIEGDPLIKDSLLKEESPQIQTGLEYLHGIYSADGSYRSFWALSKDDEKRCFEELMDFLYPHIQKHPGAHIYHYASYEISALKRLMCQYGSKEHIVDYFLRNGLFVDLYKVVRHGLLVSEPAYSIKNLEAFYMPKRSAALKSGGASVVYFEKFLETRDESIKNEIESYNRTDCESTFLLRNWLLELKKEAESKAERVFVRQAEQSTKPEEKENNEASSYAAEAELLLENYRKLLCAGLPKEACAYSNDDKLKVTLFYLVDYYRRELKPEFWEMYSRREKSEEDLLEDPECLGSLTRKDDIPVAKMKRSSLYTYDFPEQECKRQAGDQVYTASSNENAGTIFSIDYEKCQVVLKSTKDLPTSLSLIPAGPLEHRSLQKALLRFVDSCIPSFPDSRFKALLDIVTKSPPRLNKPLLPFEEDSTSPTFTSNLVELIKSLDSSYLVIQGPPGTGKTTQASQVIVSLLKSGFRIGVASHSHKAIINLLKKVESFALEDGFLFRGIKRSNRDNESTLINGTLIKDVLRKEELHSSQLQLLAGTAWLFCDEALEQSLDFLFIDEAGQVSLANALAMGTAAKNIVLLGDPMQLPQPSRGIHPESIEGSVLQYIQEEHPTIPADRGIFLNTSRRLHEAICSFISEHVYESRLKAFAENNKRVLRIQRNGNEERHFGIHCVAVNHSGNSNSSIEEACAIEELYKKLLEFKFQDFEKLRDIDERDILIVAPYNLQVNLLKQKLPPNARVGTIDKFQGQEAPVVIISMATSSEEEIPRSIDFLFSQNRLNVALTRATSLAFLVMSPDLLNIRCSTVEQMRLVNFLCAAEHRNIYGD